MEHHEEYDYEICDSRIRLIADRLIVKFEELRHIDAGRILFIVNHKGGGSKKRIVLAKTSCISEKWRDVLFQLGACSYFYVIEFYGRTTACLDENQMTALIYRELRMISPEGEIVTPDIHDWWQILTGLGRHWFYPDSSCPNLLDADVDWKKLMGADYERPAGVD